MAFFNKRRITRIAPLKVATTIIFSSYNDGSGAGPRCVRWYFLVRELNGKYYEIFSKKQLEKEADTHHNGCISKKFNTPYIEKLEPLTGYLKDPKKKVIDLQLLFDFILDMNIQEQLSTFKDNEN